MHIWYDTNYHSYNIIVDLLFVVGLCLTIHVTCEQIPMVCIHFPHLSVFCRIPSHPTGYNICVMRYIKVLWITGLKWLTMHVPSTQTPSDKQGVPSITMPFSVGFWTGNMHINLQGLLVFTNGTNSSPYLWHCSLLKSG